MSLILDPMGCTATTLLKKMFQFQREAARALGLISQVSRWYSAAVVSEHAVATDPTEKQHHPEWCFSREGQASL